MDWIDACEDCTATLTPTLAAQDPPPPSWAALFPWQRTTLLWMAAREERRTATVNGVTVTAAAPGGLVASAVGTGKTAVLVTHLLERGTAARPALVVVPAQVEQQWADEFERVGAVAGTPVAAHPRQQAAVAKYVRARRHRHPARRDGVHADGARVGLRLRHAPLQPLDVLRLLLDVARLARQARLRPLRLGQLPQHAAVAGQRLRHHG